MKTTGPPLFLPIDNTDEEDDYFEESGIWKYPSHGCNTILTLCYLLTHCIFVMALLAFGCIVLITSFYIVPN